VNQAHRSKSLHLDTRKLIELFFILRQMIATIFTGKYQTYGSLARYL